MEWAVVETLEAPDEVRRSISDPQVQLYYRWYTGTIEGDKYLGVVVKIEAADAFVRTAYPTNRITTPNQPLAHLLDEPVTPLGLPSTVSLDQLFFEGLRIGASRYFEDFYRVTCDPHADTRLKLIVHRHSQASGLERPGRVNVHPFTGRRFETNESMNVWDWKIRDLGTKGWRKVLGVLFGEQMGTHDDMRIKAKLVEKCLEKVVLARASPSPFSYDCLRVTGACPLVWHIPNQRKHEIRRKLNIS